MKLATFLAPGGAQQLAGRVEDDRIVAFGSGGAVITALSTGVVPDHELGEWPLSEITLLAPIPEPRAIFGIGLNYLSHTDELGGERPERPIVFNKVPGAVAPPGGPIRCPDMVRRLDYEGELVVVIGAAGAIGGFCVGDDVTARDLQGREPQWARAKGADTFCPCGPWITTPDEVGDPGRLRLQTWVNGELRQDANTAQLIFSAQELVDFIAETCTLSPGDLILTGTPGGVGMALDPPQFLTSGDVVRIEIERLGVIEHAVA